MVVRVGTSKGDFAEYNVLLLVVHEKLPVFVHKNGTSGGE
jgi:hypothetical protein